MLRPANQFGEAVPHRRGVAADYIEPGSISNNLDLHRLARLIIVCCQVLGVIWREVNDLWIILAHLDGDAMLFSCAQMVTRGGHG